ncbi:hypothetical protein LTR46_000382 [Exophiala xenobiotica]|nr:hypothetical protein LTR46_000382 [Exophiala xenobiotica]
MSTKTPGGSAPSEKFMKKDAAAKGLGADNAPAHKEGHVPGEASVASDSYTASQPDTKVGEKGNVGQIVGEKPSETINQGNMR